MSHIIHMYRPFLNGCSFDVMTHIWLKIKRRLSFGFGFDSPNKFFHSRMFVLLSSVTVVAPTQMDDC